MEERIIILSHGSKKKESSVVAQKIISKVQSKLTDKKITGVVLRFSQPKLATVVDELVAEGIKRIVIVPLFLLPGFYTQEYIPNRIKEFKMKYTKVEFLLAEIIGADKNLVKIITDQIKDIS
ncbi:sirohydrochlorin chelatase [Halanaerobaculum tunisiense]